VRTGGDGRLEPWLWMAFLTVLLASCAGPPKGRVIPGADHDLRVLPGAASAGDGTPGATPSTSLPDTIALVVFHRSVPDTACFSHATPWEKPGEAFLANPIRRYDLFGLFRWERGGTTAGQAATDEIQRRLGLDGIDVDRAEVHLRKDYGRRLSLVTSTGLGASAEDALEANYRLIGRWYLRSETRERGETFMELRREISFR
jgi:hypothetical protein